MQIHSIQWLNFILKRARLDEAIEKYKQALDVKPDFGAQWRIAYVYALKENYVETFKWLNHNIAVSPSPGLKAVGYWVRGFHHYWTGCFIQSMEDAQNAKDLWQPLKHEWGVVATELTKGCLNYDRGNFKLCRDYFEKVHEYVKDYRDFNLYEQAMFELVIGYVDVMEGKIDSARTRLDKVKSLLPQLREKYYWNEQLYITHYLLQMEVKTCGGRL